MDVQGQLAFLLPGTLAEQALSDPDLDLHVQALRDRFAAARRRGDSAHQREEARFALRLLGQPDTALQLARDNWKVQREPSDVRILLESALASGDDEAARLALEFLDRTGLEDVRLAQLSTQARRSPQ